MSGAQPPLELGEPTPAEEVGYARVSDADHQDPDFQIQLLKKRGIPDDNIFVDHASGRSMKRPQLDLALKLMTGRPGWTLVVYKLDRLGRNLKGILELLERFDREGWNLVSLTEQIDTRTPMGKFVFGIMAMVAQLESDLISERTKDGIANRAAQGYPVGRSPKLSRKQFEKLDRAIVEEKDATIAQLAKRFRIAEVTLRKWFPDWRNKTPEQRAAFRATKPFPEK